MNKQEILENISIQFEQMIEQFEVICLHADKVPQEEMDKMLAEARATYELFVVLNHVNSAVPEKNNSLLSKIQQTKQMMASIQTKVEDVAETIIPSVEEKTMEVPVETISVEKEEIVKPIEEVPTPSVIEEEIKVQTEEIKIEEPTNIVSTIAEEVVVNTVAPAEKPATENVENNVNAATEKVEIETPVVVLAEEKSAVVEEAPAIVPTTPILTEEVKTPIVEEVKETISKSETVVNEQEKVASTVSQVENPFAQRLNTESAPKGIHNKSLEEEDGFIADKIGVKIADLKKNVALHEKFLYINELFGGNNNAYNEMIDAIENAENAQNASEILAYYGNKFTWNPEGKTFKQLRLLIQRRF